MTLSILSDRHGAAFRSAASLILILSFTATTAAEDHPGRALFSAAGCQTCHKIGDIGGNTGPDLTLVGFRHSRTWLDLWIKDPRAWKKDTLMPDLRLSAKAREAIVDFLSAQKGQAWSAGRPWHAGKTIYIRAGCVACHGAGGAGGHPNNNVKGGMIPALAGISETFTPQELHKKISRGVKPEKADAGGPEPLILMPPWGEILKDAEIDAVGTYLLSLGAGKKKPDW